MKVLITAGPTREPLDPVRFLSNHSTGAMGFALAEAVLQRGHEALLVLGPVADQPPVGSEVYGVETAQEMSSATFDFLHECGAVICAAAVADFRPRQRSATKLKRGSVHGIELVENPDIAAEVGARRGSRPFAIFALESEDGEAHARAKLAAKRADVCVLNTPAAIGAETARFTLLLSDGTTRELGRVAKLDCARALLDSLGIRPQ